MDFLPTLRVLLRRWYLTVPLLLLAAGAVALSLQASPITYQARGVVVFYPSPTADTDQKVARIVATNPYARYDLQSAIDVFVRIMSSPEKADTLRSVGVTGTLRVGERRSFDRGPYVDIAISEPSQAKAVKAVNVAMADLVKEVRTRQLDYGADPDYLVTAEVLYKPTYASKELTAAIRQIVPVLAVVMIPGLLLLYAIDGLSRRKTKSAIYPNVEAAVGSDPPPKLDN